jgi:hypothetical protein
LSGDCWGEFMVSFLTKIRDRERLLGVCCGYVKCRLKQSEFFCEVWKSSGDLSPALGPEILR